MRAVNTCFVCSRQETTKPYEVVESPWQKKLAICPRCWELVEISKQPNDPSPWDSLNRVLIKLHRALVTPGRSQLMRSR